MQKIAKEILWNQFGASIDMLENAIKMCSSEFWDDENKFWYYAFHCLFFLDYYLTVNAKTFAPPLPFSMSEFEDRMPERTYTKEELLTYLNFCREKCCGLILSFTEESAYETWTNQSKTMTYPMIELMLYNMRHVQHHTAQLNLILRQNINDAPNWVSRTEVKLSN